MKKITTIILSSLLILSGCSGGGLSLGGGSSSDPNPEDITGTGLKISLDLNDQWISQKKIGYRLEIENTGSEEIKLSKSNFKLYTLQVDETGTKSVFTQNSLDKFYDTIFETEGGAIYLPQNAKLSDINGQLIIDDWYFQNLNYENFEYTLQVDYPTKTHFNNNIEITKSAKKILTVTDKLSQAAPVQITKISMTPFEKDIYYLEYLIQNKGSQSSQDFEVRLSEFNFELGSESLDECSGFIDVDGTLRKISEENLVLNEDKSQLKYICKINLKDFEDSKTTTTTTGQFEYDYSNIISGKINLPTKRESEDIFE
jgi:hypothetical protein